MSGASEINYPGFDDNSRCLTHPTVLTESLSALRTSINYPGFDDNSRCLVRQKSIIRALMIILGVWCVRNQLSGF
ncbi:hypothetical protein [Limnospira platensis]|uniref:hypothetical protein n=1 Tax=Limnospira platensis TaxID=118562 RepID=UPI0001D0E30F|nr:hypothetical protein [Arthrospira platensis NCB002]BAI89291.1 hypothetical protein NIES39_C04250 [Arthrospira platensis NIES-39]